jgi:hypothetical protein
MITRDDNRSTMQVDKALDDNFSESIVSKERKSIFRVNVYSNKNKMLPLP